MALERPQETNGLQVELIVARETIRDLKRVNPDAYSEFLSQFVYANGDETKREQAEKFLDAKIRFYREEGRIRTEEQLRQDALKILQESPKLELE